MKRDPAMRRLFRLVRRRDEIEQDVDDELALHLALTEERLRRDGLSEREAKDEAQRRFGDVTEVRRQCVALGRQKERKVRISELIESVLQDAWYAVRSLKRAPGFAAVALLTLALGIGANTALFSVVRGVLLRPLPYPQSERLVRVWPASPENGVARGTLSSVDLADWRERQRTFEALGAYWHAEGMSGVDLLGEGEPVRLPATHVSVGFFETLKTPALIGRALEPGDNVDGQSAVIVLSERLWRTRFGADPDILGRTIQLSDKPVTVVGVMPAGFGFPSPTTEAWLPIAAIPESGIPRQRQVRWLAVIGRLAPGMSIEAARADLARITRELEAEHPASNGKWNDVVAMDLRDATVGPMRTALWVLLGAVAFILLIACANLANLLLARASVRERELAVRSALGAGRRRLLRQLLTESLLLSLAGGLLGLLLARFGVDALVALAAGQLPRAGEVRMDSSVLLFALGVSVVTGLIFGLLPALRAARPQLQPLLAGVGRSVGGHGARLRSALVVVEVALAVLLAVGAGLTTRSLVKLLSVDLGFRPEGAAVVSFSVSSERYPGQERRADYHSRVLQAIRSAPGVSVAGAAKALPLQGEPEALPVGFPDRPAASPSDLPRVDLVHVSTDYFRALGTPLLAGRAFTESDDANVPGRVMVNEAFVRQYLPGQSAVGAQVLVGGQPPTDEIIGVVGDIKQVGLADPPVPTVYVHYLQNSRSLHNVVVRGSGDPLQLAASVRQAIWGVDPQQTITRITTLEELSGNAVAQPRLLAVLLGAFALLGLVLGAVGIYGVLAYTVSQRRQEFGVRMALGAEPGSVLRLVLKRGLLLAGTGVVIGLVGALGASRLLQSILYGVAAADPVTFAVVALVLFTVALTACYLPARRATRVDPATALRAE